MLWQVVAGVVVQVWNIVGGRVHHGAGWEAWWCMVGGREEGPVPCWWHLVDLG